MFYTPTPKEIREARISSDLTQKTCADMCLVTVNSWARYEQGKIQMSAPIWELFILKVAQLTLEAKPVASKAVDPNITTPAERAFFEEFLSDWEKEEKEKEAKNWVYRDGRPFV
jgi:transcriptional regulator with XRE-family HTH domain